MIRILLIFAIAVGLNLESNQAKVDYMIDYENTAYSLTNEAGQKIHKKFGLVPIGSGGIVKDKVKKLSLSVLSSNELKIENARALIVGSMNEYLKVINNDILIRPYLEYYPFTENNIELNIFVERPEDEKKHFGKLIVITSYKGRITYKVLKNDDHETVLEESFEEAVRIVREGK